MSKMVSKIKKSIMPVEIIEQKIFLIRGRKVMIDADIAELYGVTTKVLNQAVKRNASRFPEDFMFQLTTEEFALWNRSQFVTGSEKHRNSRFLPYAFTEHGVMMLSSVLTSEYSVEMSLFIVRTFIKLREMLATHKDLAHKFNELVRVQMKQGDQIESIQRLLLRLTTEGIKTGSKIGFRVND